MRDALHGEIGNRIPECKRVFISYRHVERDLLVAREVAQALRTKNHVFIDTDISPGQRWGDIVENELQTCDFLIAVTSEKSSESNMVLTEVAAAHELRAENEKPVIIPVRLGFDGLRYPVAHI